VLTVTKIMRAKITYSGVSHIKSKTK